MDTETVRGSARVTPAERERRTLTRQAVEASRLVTLLGNANRLLILCYLMARKEMNVGELVDVVDLSQSALSQHLTKLREDGFVAARRDSLHVYYRIADPRVAKLIRTLKKLCYDDLE